MGSIMGSGVRKSTRTLRHRTLPKILQENPSAGAICSDLLGCLKRDNPDRPVIGIVSRFAGQKGFDLIEQTAWQLLQDNVALVVLGTGEPHYEWLMRRLAEHFPDKAAVRIEFNNELAHKVEAGSDIFLMPSHYEPCGLNQIYSLRYGTVPVVRATGGLDDTIDENTGFKFADYSADGAASLAGNCRAYLPDRQGPMVHADEKRYDAGPFMGCSRAAIP